MATSAHNPDAARDSRSDAAGDSPDDDFSVAANRPQKSRRSAASSGSSGASGVRSPGLDALIEALRVQPGIGPRSAQRIAFYLLQHDRDGARNLGQALLSAVNDVRHCSLCNNFTQNDICDVCLDGSRDPALLCVVEMPTDQMLIEQTKTFNGRYFVLMGHLSPLDGIGPKDLKMDKLIARALDGQVKEVVLATNFSNEGEATAFYVSEILKAKGLSVSRLARGVPAGAELEYVDAGTIARAMLDRQQH